MARGQRYYRRLSTVFAGGVRLVFSARPAVPAALWPLPAGAEANRLGLAKWLVDPANPLTGRVAAQAFATLCEAGQSVKRVVLIGPAHFVPVRGIAAPTVDAFETPLGRVPVDRDALSAISELVVETDAPHAPGGFRRSHSRPTPMSRPAASTCSAFCRRPMSTASSAMLRVRAVDRLRRSFRTMPMAAWRKRLSNRRWDAPAAV